MENKSQEVVLDLKSGLKDLTIKWSQDFSHFKANQINTEDFEANLAKSNILILITALKSVDYSDILRDHHMSILTNEFRFVFVFVFPFISH